MLVINFLFSCSTEKKSIVNITYHNTTARYNGYFNAKESVNEGLEKIQKGYTEDYTELLPIFVEGDNAAARSVYPEMDRAIEKCTDVIQRHSMYIKKEEYCKWIDNSYLLIGIANYYKKDYQAANEMFDFVSKEYQDNPERFDALMWMAKSYIGMKNYNKASSLINEVEANGNLPKKKKALLKAIRADMYINQKSYGAAATALDGAVALTKDKKLKARYTFIIAQLYQLQNNTSKASEYYAKVVKMNPEYEMAFYAKINRAMSYEKGSGSFADIKEELNKMLKDEKNIDYFDQIYFALAELELKQGYKEKGIELLELSAATSKENLKQKAKTHLKLATLYFNDKDYINAQSNYDSTVTYLDRSRDDYLDILDMRNSLTRIVKDITIIQREDSLQRLAAMPQKQVDKIISNIIDEIIEEEEIARQEKINQQNAILNQNQNPMANKDGGGWYFYNPSTVSFGKADFQKKWGDRKLEDHWRRKDKNSGALFTDDVELEQIEEEDTLANANDLKSPNYYLKNIPNTNKKMKASHNAIIEALYDLGVQYKEELNDDKEAIQTFESLIDRYDTSRYHMNSYYQLYRLYLNSDGSKADYYKKLILDNYGESQYAKLLKNPNYFNEINAEQDKINDLYEAALTKYTGGYYSSVLFYTEQAKTKHSDNDLLPKFLYLEALSLSATKDTVNLRNTLTTLSEDYIETEEGKKAKSALDQLNSGKKPTEIESNKDTDDGKYLFQADRQHNFILLVPSSIMNDSDVKNAISDFNTKYYRKSNLTVKGVLFGTDKRMYIVKDFNNSFSAMDYYNTFSENKEELSQVNASKYKAFVISIDNYPNFYKDKDVDGYETFFINRYKN